MMRSQAVRRQAFTLLEMLIASVICAALFGSLFALMFGTLRLREKAFRAGESGPPREQVIQIIRRDIENAVVPNGTLASPLAGLPSTQSGAAQDSLAFYTTTGAVTGPNPCGDIQQVKYFLSEAADTQKSEGYDLIRRTTRNLLASVIVEDLDDEQWTLLRDVRSLQIQYWDTETSQWITNWDSAALDNANPGAIRMHIEFVNANEEDRIELPIDVVYEVPAQAKPSDASVAGTNSGAATGSASGGTASTAAGSQAR